MNSKAIRKQLLAAVAMVLVAAVALGSSTYAWFVASGTVTATGMNVTVQAEGGILIKEYGPSDTAFSTVATVKETSARALYPASTADLTNWYSSKATTATDANADNTDGYTDLDEQTENTINQYRYLKTFAIRSANNAQITKANLLIESLTLTVTGKQTVNLDNSIRVGVKLRSGGADKAKFYVYAPKTTDVGEGAAAEYFTLDTTYDGALDANPQLKEYKQVKKTDILALNGNIIPNNDTGLLVDVYIWYEGEDQDCKTANLIGPDGALTPDTIAVTITFKQVADTYTGTENA